MSKYGWRIYALPVLLLLTVFVIADASGDPVERSERALRQSPGQASAPTVPATADAEPHATESPVDPPDMNIPTAKLPDGGAYTERGKGSWHVVRGKSAVVGKSGRIFRYTVEVEDGIDASSYGGDDAFASVTEATLADPRSWTGGGDVRFQRINDSAAADFRVSLTTPETNHQPGVCGYTIKYESSCYRGGTERHVVINLARWVRGAKSFNADLGAYRQYAINHEVGHALGNGHVGCPKDNGLAPVMMQQTFGVANDYVAKLNATEPSNAHAVPRDGKVCKPNAWPNPGA